MQEEIRCPDCGDTNIEHFSKHNRSRTGYQTLCKPCFKKKYWTPKRRKYDGVACEVDGCHNQAVTRGMCRKHYKQVYTHGHTYEGTHRKCNPKPPPPPIIPTDGIVWGATTNPLFDRGE